MRPTTSRRDFLRTAAAGSASLALAGLLKACRAASGEPPNFVVIFTDDRGYNDLGVYGSHEIIHHQPKELIVRESGAGSGFYLGGHSLVPKNAKPNLVGLDTDRAYAVTHKPFPRIQIYNRSVVQL